MKIYFLCMFICSLWTLLIIDRARFTIGKIAISIIAVACASVVIGGRNIYLQDDLLVYFDMFHNFANGDYEQLKVLGGGIEFGLPAIFIILSPFINIIDINSFCTLMSAISGLCLIYCVHNIWKYKYRSSSLSYLLVLSICLFSFFGATHTTRQVLSSLFLLLALIHIDKRKSLFYLMLAAVFHLTAILFYFIAKLLIHIKKTSFMLIVMAAFLFSLYYAELVNIVISAGYFIGSEKINVLKLINNENDTKTVIVSVFKLVMLVILGIYSQYKSRDKYLSFWISYLMLNVVVIAVFFKFPYIGGRFATLVLDVCGGILFFMFTRHNRAIQLTGSSVLVLYQAHLLSVYSGVF